MEERMEVANILIKYNKLDMALEVLEEAKQSDSENEEIYFTISDIYEKQSMYDESLKVLNEVKIRQPENGQVYFKIGNIYQQKEDYTSCFENLSLAIEKGYESEKVFFYKGLVHEKLGQQENAMEYYDKSLSKNITYMAPKYRKYAIYMKMNKMDEAEDVLKGMIKYNGDDYDGYNLMFAFLMLRGRQKEALEILNKAKQIFNSYEPLDLEFVKYYMAIKNMDKAEKIIDMADEESEYFDEFMIKKAQILCMRGKHQQAMEILTDKKVYDEDNLTLLYLLAVVNSQCEKYEEAIKFVDKLESHGEYSDQRTKTAMILKGYCMRNIEEREKVQEYFSHVYKILQVQSMSNPYDINNLLLRSMVLIELKEFEKCDELLKGIEKLNFEEYNSYVGNIRELLKGKMEDKEVNEYEILHRNGYLE